MVDLKSVHGGSTPPFLVAGWPSVKVVDCRSVEGGLTPLPVKSWGVITSDCKSEEAGE